MRNAMTSDLRRSASAMLVAFVAITTMLFSPTPAGAAEVDTTDALVALESEVLALVELGAFPSDLPPKVAEVDAEWRSAVDGYGRSDLIDWLNSSDADAAAELVALDGVELSVDVRRALQPLPEQDVRAVEAGSTVRIPAEVYEHALNDLEYRNGTAPARPVGQIPTPRPQTGGPSGTAAPTSGAAPPADGASSSGSPWALVGVGVGALALVGAIAALLAQRRRPDHLTTSVAELLDASRRLNSTVDVGEIYDILVREALALTRSDDVAVVVRGESAGAVVLAAASSPGVIDVDLLGRSAVARVLDAGAVVRMAGVDPALGDGEWSIVAVPLVRSGAVSGAVVAVRRGAHPYGSVEVDLLAQLVPTAASALAAAGRHDDVAELSLTDGLTDLGNRRRLDRDLVSALGVGAGTVGFVMVDIDHFKLFNDTNGHVAGDEALREVAQVLRESVRDRDVVYRYGGEEFCVLLPDATAAEAAEISERLRCAVERRDFVGAEAQPGGRLTISVGTTVASRMDPVAVKQRADQALYEAKHLGRNRVVIDESDPS